MYHSAVSFLKRSGSFIIRMLVLLLCVAMIVVA
jgi:hypothetical protein